MGLPRCSHITVSILHEYFFKKATHEISTVRVHLSSKVLRCNVDLGLVDEADNLDVIGGAHELHTLEGVVGDQTGTTAGLGAPCDHLAFGVGHEGVGVFRGPEAEI